jgi:hypothetical protein
MGKKNYDKKDMNHNMTGEHSNGRRNPNPMPPQSARQAEKEDKINKPPVHNN